MTYIDLSSVIDIEPRTEDVLELVDNDDLIDEVIRRIESGLLKDCHIKELVEAINE